MLEFIKNLFSKKENYCTLPLLECLPSEECIRHENKCLKADNAELKELISGLKGILTNGEHARAIGLAASASSTNAKVIGGSRSRRMRAEDGGYENIVKNLLIQAGHPLNIKSIVRRMGSKYKGKKSSVAACLHRHVRTNRTFTRTAPCMFGLLEWVKE